MSIWISEDLGERKLQHLLVKGSRTKENWNILYFFNLPTCSYFMVVCFYFFSSAKIKENIKKVNIWFQMVYV